MWAAAANKGVQPGDFNHLYGDMASVALWAQIEAFRRQHVPDVDPVAVLTETIHATGWHLGQDVTVLEGPLTYKDGPGAYVVVQRVPQTPPWGMDGDLNLIVHLRHGDDMTMKTSWEWTAHPDNPGGTSHYVTIIAPPPDLASASEVGERIAGVLTGAVKAWPTSRPGGPLRHWPS